MKEYAEIDGQLWQAMYPLCAGCPELIVTGGCAYEGNGCRFPERRIEKPRCFHTAYLTVRAKYNLKDEEVRKWEKEKFGT